MLRILLAAVVLTLAVFTFMPDLVDEASDSGAARVVRDFGEGTVPSFRSRLEAGASCAELISIRDTYHPLSDEVGRMNDELRAIGCDSISAARTD